MQSTVYPKLVKILASIFLIFLAVQSNCQPICKDCGVVVVHTNFYEKDINDYMPDELYGPSFKIWYKDSCIIQQTKRIKGIGGHDRRVETMHYTYINLRQKSFYDYTTFSDSATLIKKYKQADSVPVYGGWNFYAEHNLPSVEKIVGMPDTIINGISMKRFKVIQKFEGSDSNKETISILYSRCDKKDTMFKFLKSLSEKLGCPIVRQDYLPFQTPRIKSSSQQLEFVSETLTVDELKVFEAWERNARENPVGK